VLELRRSGGAVRCRCSRWLGTRQRPAPFTAGGENLKYATRRSSKGAATAELGEATLCSKRPHHHPASRCQQCEKEQQQLGGKSGGRWGAAGEDILQHEATREVRVERTRMGACSRTGTRSCTRRCPCSQAQGGAGWPWCHRLRRQEGSVVGPVRP
jgi:hypothetical protein